MIEPGHTIKLLDHGYIKYIGHMGSDESFVEAARMSTGKGFLGWYWEEDTYNDSVCQHCRTQHIYDTLPVDEEDSPICTNCWYSRVVYISMLRDAFPGPAMPKDLVVPKLAGKKGAPKDFGLLNTLYANKHSTPFEMGELCLEVMAPLMVFREWQRHRMQSYNEFSGRYSAMPNVHYVPEPSRIQKQSTANKQGSAEALALAEAGVIIGNFRKEQDEIYDNYQDVLEQGVAKEVARLNTPLSRYSKMRAKTDIRNWLAFLLLRMDKAAQYEIRVYAEAVAQLIKMLYPKTYELFLEYDLLGTRFSRTELRVLRALAEQIPDMDYWLRLAGTVEGFDEKKVMALYKKLLGNKEEEYKDVI